MGDPTHKTYVQVQGEFFVAACHTCFTQDIVATASFRTRDNMDDAESDAEEHGTLEHLAPREELIAQAEKARQESAAAGPIAP